MVVAALASLERSVSDVNDMSVSIDDVTEKTVVSCSCGNSVRSRCPPDQGVVSPS